MVSSTILAFAAIFLLYFKAPPVLLAVCPEMLSVGALMAGFLWGPRAIAALLPVCWALLSASWVVEDRLELSLQGLDIGLSGIVCDIPVAEAGLQRFVFLVDEAARDSGIPRRISVSWYDSELPTVRAGERWQLTIRLKRPRGAVNPAGFDFERWAFTRSIGATGYVRPAATNRRLSSGAGCALAAFRQRVATDLLTAIPDARAPGYLLALAVGIRHRLTDHDWRILRRTGTTHLLAISGLHIGLAAAFSFFCARQFGRGLLLAGLHCRPLAWARTAALAGALCYGALAGFSVPTIRALVMTITVIGLTGLHRAVSIPFIVAFALYVIFWIVPFAMLSSGFWLSFGAVGVLLLSGFVRFDSIPPPVTTTGKFMRGFRQLLRIQFCLGIGLLPATAFFFGQISLVAPVANLLVVPLFAVWIVPLLITGILALMIVPAIAPPVLEMADYGLAHVIALLDWIDGWRWLPVAKEMPGLSGVEAAAGTAVALVLIWPRPLPGRVSLVLSALVLTCFAGAATPAPSLRVVVIDVGQGLAVLVQTPGHNVLFDTGPRYRRGDAGRSIVLPVLHHFGVTRLDRLVVSHGDADHAGGAGSVLAAYPGTRLLASARIDAPGGRFELCRSGQQWHYDGVDFRILHPASPANRRPWSENDASCVLLVRSANFSLLLPGDIERQAERYLVSNGSLLPVDLVVAPHHGSRTSSTAPFVAATRPAYVVFSAGYRNRWNFPAADVRRRWSDTGSCVLTTGNLGALVFEAHDDRPLRLVLRARIDRARIWTEYPSDGSAAGRCRPSASTNSPVARL